MSTTWLGWSELFNTNSRSGSKWALIGFAHELRTAYRFAEQVEINLPTAGWDIHVPFGGYKASGLPFKEQGLEGFRFYSKVKTIVMDSG